MQVVLHLDLMDNVNVQMDRSMLQEAAQDQQQHALVEKYLIQQQIPAAVQIIKLIQTVHANAQVVL